MPNHTLNFDGVLWQHFANQRNRFLMKSPPVCTIVAIKGPISKFLKLLGNLSLDLF
jgi:hypothetical protein